ncbi:MAG: MGMT family protein [Bifidobacterium tibiigranuli]|nr:MGMT family protein [Bifidobacterium tibiigranuli]MCI1673879.1 MGMT family protein [Bifidobacterium tibiigranuli]MCI1712128.1 MGMT family protein [Bifidobacterium tibiigranuli]
MFGTHTFDSCTRQDSRGRSAARPGAFGSSGADRHRVFEPVADNRVMSESFSSRVYDVVRRIPMGKVATYGQVAALAGNPRNARIVGYALHSNPEPGVIPCHRVVFRDGSLAPGFAFGGPERQRALLEDEGVSFIPPAKSHANAGEDGWLVDLQRCQWQE